MLLSFYINDKSVSSSSKRLVREGLKPSRLLINKLCFLGKAYHINAARLALSVKSLLFLTGKIQLTA